MRFRLILEELKLCFSLPPQVLVLLQEVQCALFLNVWV